MKIMAMGGAASPAKLGQKLGPYGIGAKFCQDFNAKTGDRRDELAFSQFMKIRHLKLFLKLLQ